VGLIAIRLTRLCEQNERRGIGSLKTEGEIQEDERIEIEFENTGDVQSDPQKDHQRLSHEKERRSKKTGESLGLQGEPIIPENRIEVEEG
jgi:hypothetical protein